MKLLEKILLATDFDRAANDALQTALYVAKGFNSEIILLHVIPESKPDSISMDAVKDALKTKLRKLKEEIVEKGVQIKEMVVESGSPFDRIITQADRKDANVIIMGDGNKTPTDKFPLGITAGKVMSKANKPVWVVKHGFTAPIKKILCPVDFSRPSKHALDNAIHLARDFKVKLVVLHIIAPTSTALLDTGIERASEQQTHVEYEKTHFDPFLKCYDFYNVDWEKEIRYGKPHEEILKVVTEKHTDLIIMGSAGKTGLSRILLGSVAEKVTREVPCSVITMKSEDAIRLYIEAQIDDLETHFKEGRESLEEGFAEAALQEFRHCLTIDAIFAPAWEGIAAAYERQGKKSEALNAREQAKMIRVRFEEQRIEAEIRGQHFLFSKKHKDF